MVEIDFKLALSLQQADEIVLRFAPRSVHADPQDVALLPEEKDFIARTVAAAVGAVPKPDFEQPADDADSPFDYPNDPDPLREHS